MKATKLITLVFTITAAMTLASCLGNDDKNTYSATSTLGNMFNAVVDIDPSSASYGEVTLYDNISYKIEWEYSDFTADMTITGLRLPNTSTYPSITATGLKWTYNTKGWMDISLSDYTPSNYTSSLMFDKFNLQMISRTYNSLTFPPCLNISYTVNGTYKVYSLPTQMLEVGLTKITGSDGSEYTQTDTDRSIYCFMLDPITKKGYIVVQDAKFYAEMLPIIMKFPGISFDVDQMGNIIMTAAEIEPTQLSNTSSLNDVGTPLSDVKITGFAAHYVPGSGTDMAFDYVVTAEGETKTYHVSFMVKFPDNTSTQS